MQKSRGSIIPFVAGAVPEWAGTAQSRTSKTHNNRPLLVSGSFHNPYIDKTIGTHPPACVRTLSYRNTDR